MTKVVKREKNLKFLARRIGIEVLIMHIKPEVEIRIAN